MSAHYCILATLVFIITISCNLGAMKHVNRDLLIQGFIVLLPVFDEAGRAIVYVNSSKYKQMDPNNENEVSSKIFEVYEVAAESLYSNLLVAKLTTIHDVD